MPKIFIIANWKCNPQTLKEAARLFDAAEENVRNVKNDGNFEVVICAPSVFLCSMQPPLNPPLSQTGSFATCNSFGIKKGGRRGVVKLGAQNCFWEQRGPFTGEVSPTMLKSVNCEYVILGHSKRRECFGETDEIINFKIKAALIAGLKPILCIGEKKEEREKAKEVIEQQLCNGLEGVSKGQLVNIVIVYEPVWAISTTTDRDDCTPDEAFSSSLMIRKFLINLYDKYTANKVKIVYGGSVDSSNAASYITEAKMDGVLVGAASLSANEFAKIIKSVVEISQNSDVKS